LYGDGYLLAGDAFAFVDPVFSSGVFLAMKSAESGAEAVDAILDGAGDANALLARHERYLLRGIQTVAWFIYRFNSPTMRHLFMNPSDKFRIKAAVVSILAGDIYGRTPIGIPVFIFKVIYAAHNLWNWRGSMAFTFRRRRNNRMTDST
jgi:hypothetical protein